MKGQFLTNYTDVTFLDKLKQSLATCHRFYFSVSFIKKAGLKLLSRAIEEALERGVEGRIITSTYQNFTDIASLEYFLGLQEKYPNFSCHLDNQSFGSNGYHSKGYLFEQDKVWELIIGSSNITAFALKRNVEWNMLVETKEENPLVDDILNEFQYLWDKTAPLTRNKIKDYMVALDYAIEKWDMDYIDTYTHVKPNYMQRKALKEIRRYRDMGVDRALVIAATGSGKTYLSAFDARNFEAGRLLFIAHRDMILNHSLETFKKVFGETKTYGLFTGEYKEIDSDFLFSTNIMMSKNLSLFEKDAFDYIVVDEVHHAVADTYQQIINYFTPEFLLGLTATPERMDEQSVFDLFEKNVPYELRLRDALLNELIVPFKYYGIRDHLIDYDEKSRRKLAQQLSSIEHCEFISEEIEKYHPDGKLKAVGFCRSVEHARQMAESMETLGYHTIYLTGASSTGERIKAFRDLQDNHHPLQIIFTVDILNEGIDVPGINMVLFLRPTESSTIFIQQLGRGLRKYEGKDYLTVLDFIGNSYERSVQIALALGSLSASTSLEKPLLMDLVRDDFRALDLPVEIYIDKLSKEEILSYIEKTNFNRKDFLEQDYKNFKKFIKSDTYPSHMDYLNNDSAPNLIRFMQSKISGKKNVSYYNFLLKIGEEVPSFDKQQVAFIDYLSDFVPLIRPYEFAIVQSLMEGPKTKAALINELLKEEILLKQDQFDHALLNLQNEFASANEKKNNPQYVVETEGVYQLTIDLSNGLFVDYVKDLLSYGLSRYAMEFGNFEGNLKLYGSYSTKQFMMAIGERSLAYYKGTKIEEDGTVYILANLKKDESLHDRLKYNDKFINEHVFQWESRNGVTLDSTEGKKLIASKEAHLFIRKVKEEDGITLPYIYIGKGHLTNPRPSDNEAKSLLFDVELEHEIPEYLRYEFLIPEDEESPIN